MGKRQEGKGTSEVPKVLKREWKALGQAMKANGWTFTQGKGYVRAYAPRWVDGSISVVSLPLTPSDHRAFANNRSSYRRWCDENGVARNI